MAFCSNCGKKIKPDEDFCRTCAKGQDSPHTNCTNCGIPIEENENFCSGCGKPVSAEPKKEEELMEERKKDGGSFEKSNHNNEASKPSFSNLSKKKKHSYLFAALAIIIVVGAIVVSYTTNWLDKTKDYLSALNVKKENPILEYKNKDSEKAVFRNQKTKEKKNVDEMNLLTNTIEDIFEKADTAKLKLFLNDSSREKYESIMPQIFKYMPKYAKAFKNRKLISDTDTNKVYEFSDDSGKKHTVSFELQADGTWKLNRF